jgi:hypothetical protein
MAVMDDSQTSSENWSRLHDRIVELAASGRANIIETLTDEETTLRSDVQLLID